VIDLHTHCIFSDGELAPSELARRALVKGYRALAITDHGDLSNMDFIIPRIVRVSESLSKLLAIQVIPGIELTHVPPAAIGEIAREARRLGARLVVVHGETLVEPVSPGTNAAALDACVDILAHPGLISEAEVSLAARKGICLEITTRRGHSLTNGHVAALARKCGALLVLNTDAHGPHDLVSLEMARKIALGAGLDEQEVAVMVQNSEALVRKVVHDA
jgi:putative hydrolase